MHLIIVADFYQLQKLYQPNNCVLRFFFLLRKSVIYRFSLELETNGSQAKAVDQRHLELLIKDESGQLA